MWRCDDLQRSTRARRPGWRPPMPASITDIIACPGLDYCALANARSIPVAQEISERFGDAERQARDRRAEDQDFRLHQRLRPSPCRPHRHARRREEGRGALPDHPRRLRRRATSIGEIIGRGFEPKKVTDAIETSSTPISGCAESRPRPSSKPIAGSARSRSRRRSTARRFSAKRREGDRR